MVVPEIGPFQVIEVVFPLLIAGWVLRELIGFLWAQQIAAPAAPTPPAREPVTRRDYAWAFGIALAFFLLGLWRLGVPDKPVFDEVYHARSGMEYVAGTEPHEWTHPPLTKLTIAASLRVFGASFDARDGKWKDSNNFGPNTTFAWRFPSLLWGAFSLLALYALARSLFGSRFTAICATLLLACDGVFFVQSRIAMTNVFTVCFTLLATLGTYQFFQTQKTKWLWLTGLALGLGLSTRWTVLWVWGLTGLALLWHLWAVLRPLWIQNKTLTRGLVWWVGWVVLVMFGIPALLYTLSYIPYVLQTDGTPAVTSAIGKLFSANANSHGWGKVWTMQGDMWRYHAGIKETHSYSSPWWSWPLMVRPTWYFYEQPGGKIAGIWAIGNAAIWWASVPALLCCVYLAHRDKSRALGLVALFGLGQWLPWGIEPRSLTFMHYYFETIPFACLILAHLLYRLWHSDRETYRMMASTYGTLVLSWFIFYYPLLSAYPIPPPYFRQHLWLGKPWI